MFAQQVFARSPSCYVLVLCEVILILIFAAITREPYNHKQSSVRVQNFGLEITSWEGYRSHSFATRFTCYVL